MKKFSIVVPVYFNESNLPETVPALLALAEKLPGYQLELIFVDDGSKDKSLSILLDFQKKYPDRIKVVKLTRNFGSLAAIQAGLQKAAGDCVGMISADLQDPPELFVEMIRQWEKGVKTVFAVRQDRKDAWSVKFFAGIHYALLRRFGIRNYPSQGFDFFLIDRQVVDQVNECREKNSNLFALIFWLGYDYAEIPYVRQKRRAGRSRWTFGKRAGLFIDSFISFSYVPLRFFSVLGLLLSAAAFAYGVFVFVYAWIYGFEVKGWTTLVVLLIFTAGVQMSMLGVLGEYLWRTLDQARRRPGFVIDREYE